MNAESGDVSSPPGEYTFAGAELICLHGKGGDSMPAAITATATATTYRFDITAPANAERVTLYDDGVQSGKPDQAAPWVFTRTCDIRATPHIIEAVIEGPFDTITVSVQVPEGPPLETRQVHLAWHASADPAVTGYRMKAGEQSTQYSIVSDVGNRLDGAITIPLAWSTAYFCVAAYTATNSELLSDEMSQTWSA